MIENRDAIADIHGDLHIVFNQNDRSTAIAQILDKFKERSAVAAGGSNQKTTFVKQDEIRSQSERPTNLKATQQAKRKIA